MELSWWFRGQVQVVIELCVSSANKQTNKQTTKQTNKQTDRQTDRQANTPLNHQKISTASGQTLLRQYERSWSPHIPAVQKRDSNHPDNGERNFQANMGRFHPMVGMNSLCAFVSREGATKSQFRFIQWLGFLAIWQVLSRLSWTPRDYETWLEGYGHCWKIPCWMTSNKAGSQLI